MSSPMGIRCRRPTCRNWPKVACYFVRHLTLRLLVHQAERPFLPGLCPHNNGMFGLAHRGFSLNDYSQHILHTLRPAGYRSALIGIQHIAQNPALIGYDEIVPAKSNRAEHVAPAAVNFLKNAPKQPFFLDVGFFETHREFHPAARRKTPATASPRRRYPTLEGTRKDIAEFKASARVLDTAIGDVLTALESSGLAEQHARGVHHRSWHRVPGDEMQPAGPWHGSDADDAQARVASRAAKSATPWSRTRPVSDTLRSDRVETACRLQGVPSCR